MDRLVRSGMKLSECERRVLRMTGRSSPWGLTERSPWVILKRAMIMSRLLIRRCSRLHHPRSSSKLVTLDVLLYRRRHHWAPRRCILSILYEPLFSTPGRGSQTLEQYSTWGRTSFYELCLLKLTNLPVSFFLESQACGLPWLLSRQCVDSTWDRLRTVSLQVFRVITRLYWSTMQVISMLKWGFRPPDAQHLTLSVIKLHPGVICSDLHLW